MPLLNSFLDYVRRERFNVLVFGVIILFVSLIGYFNVNARTTRLMTKGKIGAGFLDEVSPGVRSGTDFSYYYYVDAVLYKGESGNMVTSERMELIKKANRPLVVLYDSINPAASELLISPESFQRFGIHSSDSLNWLYAILESD
jgi:hypothetical protein